VIDEATDPIHPFVGLIRRYVLDYLACGNPEVCAEIMVPDYLLHMGGHELGPRDEVYVPAVARQMEQFPGLCMTANEVLCNGDRLALRFSQHGASRRHDNRTAAWSGIGLYFWDGRRLTGNWALEDYYARRRQLAEGSTNNLEPPAVAPWDEPAIPADPKAEEVVRRWLSAGSIHGTAGVTFDDEWDGHPCGPLIEISGGTGHGVDADAEVTVIDDLFGAGDRVAFHVTQTGDYLGGAGKDDRIGTKATLRSAGIVQVSDGMVVSGRVVRDRSGMFA
jgi:predicted ester cyclase